jgi:hypothetical protein
MEPDFSGYATKADITCSDGRTITPDAFKHQDKIEVPLVWMHNHDTPMNVLGTAVLEHRDASHPDGAGIYCYGYFNETESGLTTKELIRHKDVKALSIYANGLVEKAKAVLHGAIKEVSVVLSGANPGAFIDNIRLAHSDDYVEVFEDRAIIYSGVAPDFIAGERREEVVLHAENDEGSSEEGLTLEEAEKVYEGWSDKDKEVAHLLVGAALEQSDMGDGDDAEEGVQHSEDDAEALQHGDDESEEESTEDDTEDDESTDEEDGDDNQDEDTDTEGDLEHQEGDNMSRNQFDQNGAGATMTGIDTSKRLKHSDLEKIVAAAKRPGGSFKEGVLAHAAEYGIENIELLFPDAKVIEATPEFISRRMEWVATVLNGTKHSPFAAVKSVFADITGPEARAKGYLKGNRKEEEVFSLLARSTRPSTIYKKQKLDRDDLLDITDVNVVAWLKAEMRLMIEEELARAILVGDNRPANHPDKVKDPAGAIDGVGIRSVLKDDDLYSIKVELPSNTDSKTAVKLLVRAMDEYRGSGNATMFISRAGLTDMMLEEDRFGRPLYADRGALGDKIGVGSIVTIDLFSEYDGLYAIIVSLADYTVGSNQGGQLTSFEDFDIDFNQYKYLQETRLSGGLTRPFSAIVVTRAAGTLRVATAPSFDGDTNTIPTVTGVDYLIDNEIVTGDVVITEPTDVYAHAQDGSYLATGANRSWSFQV